MQSKMQEEAAKAAREIYEQANWSPVVALN
jgi:hypothetical protein